MSGAGRPPILVIEDGEEYTHNLTRYLGQDFDFVRAGDGAAALAALAGGPGFRAVFLDMRFDRVSPGQLLGDLAAVADRFNGDADRATRFLEDNQGTYVLAALRDAGCALPVIFSYDFDGEPRRWQNLRRRFGPVGYLTDTASPDQIRARLLEAVG
jgi:CheY-like chemotaxis protein